MIKKIAEKLISDLLKTEVKLQTSPKVAHLTLVPAEVARISKLKALDPQDIYTKINDLSGDDIIERVESLNGFINIWIKDEAILEQGKKLLDNLDAYLDLSSDKKIIIDYSGTNIAKPFSVGHLRSTDIGQANYNIHKSLGYEVTGINHIGDWGTQFGKLIYAVKTWGDENSIDQNPIGELVALYQKFHKEAEKNPHINEEAAGWFRRLELDDAEARELWKKCVSWSMAEFNRLYKILGVEIDYTIGESFFADKTQDIIDLLVKEKLLEESQGAKVIFLQDMPPAIIQKGNESTLYITRDLAAIKYRIEKFSPDEIIYHVGADQSLHFKQLFAIADKLGWSKKTKLTFAPHGLMRLPEGKMSTRSGVVVLFDDLLTEALDRVKKFQSQREGAESGNEQAIAISAIKYADLSSNRTSDVVFSFDRFIDLKGNSAIYLQYSYARLLSLIEQYCLKYNKEPRISAVSSDGIDIIRRGARISEVLELAANRSMPNILCEFTYEFAGLINSFYEKKRIITDDEEASSNNIAVIYFAQSVLGKCLDLLGVAKLDKI